MKPVGSPRLPACTARIPVPRAALFWGQARAERGSAARGPSAAQALGSLSSRSVNLDSEGRRAKPRAKFNSGSAHLPVQLNTIIGRRQAEVNVTRVRVPPPSSFHSNRKQLCTGNDIIQRRGRSFIHVRLAADHHLLIAAHAIHHIHDRDRQCRHHFVAHAGFRVGL